MVHPVHPGITIHSHDLEIGDPWRHPFSDTWQAGMAEEPHSNSAGGKAFGHWLYNRRKGAEAWIKVGIMATISEKDAPWITHMDYS